MDDRTLAICAVTLCLLGVSLTETLGRGTGHAAHSQALAMASAVPAVIAGVDGRGALREPRAFASAH